MGRYMVVLSGGPPWGLRLSQDEKMQPAITLLLPDGRAIQSGLQLGDRIISINDRLVKCVTQTHSMLQKSRGSVQIEIERYSANPLPFAYPANKPTFSPPKTVKSFGDRHYRGATEDKKRFFENLIENENIDKVMKVPKRQLEMSPIEQMIASTESEQASTIGYDSVFADLMASGVERSLESSSITTSHRISPSIDSELNAIFKSSTNANPSMMYEAYGYGEHDLEDIIEQQMAAAKAAHQAQTWGMRAEIPNAHPAEGSIEIPGRRSVAELANNLAGRLEVKAPNGQSAGRPRTPANSGGSIQLGRVLEENPNIDVANSADRPYLGRVLDGPVDPRKYFQGVPPPSALQVVSPPVQRKTPNIAQSFLKAQASARPTHSLSSNFRNGVHAGLSNNGFADPNNSPGFYRRHWGNGPNNQFTKNGGNQITNLTSVSTPQTQNDHSTVTFSTNPTNFEPQFGLDKINQKIDLMVNPKVQNRVEPKETAIDEPEMLPIDGIVKENAVTPLKTTVITKSSVSYNHPNAQTIQPAKEHKGNPESLAIRPQTSEEQDMRPIEVSPQTDSTPVLGDRKVEESIVQPNDFENTNTESSETSVEDTKKLKIPPPTPPKPTTPLHFASPAEVPNEDGLEIEKNAASELATSLAHQPVKSKTHNPDVHQARTTPVIFDRFADGDEDEKLASAPPRTMDLEASALPQKQFVYSSNTADHYGTIRRGKASLISPMSTVSSSLGTPRLSTTTNDSGFEENLTATPATPSYGSLSVNTSTSSRPVSEDFYGTSTTSTAASSSTSTVDGLIEKRPIFEEDMSNWYRGMYKRMHKVDGNDSILKYYVREGNSPNPQYATLGRDRPWTPSARLETAVWGGGGGEEFEKGEQQERKRSRSVGRTFENTSNVSAANRYAFERMKSPVPHFHLPSFRLNPQPHPCSSKSLPTNCLLNPSSSHPFHPSTPCLPVGSFCTRRISPSAANICLRCGWPRRDPSWREIDEIYERIGETKRKEKQKGLYGLTRKSSHDLHREAAANSITRRLDETALELERFVEDLDRCWKRSISSPSLNIHQTITKSATFNPGELAELTRLTREEQMYRQKAERLTEELEAQRSRRHGYIPSAAPALQKNVERFTGLLNEYGRDSPSNGLQSASPMPAGRRSTVGSSAPTNVLTCTCIYKFTAHNERELPLNKGDIVRLHREIDANWLEGERNGRVGIFPRSYVQIESEFERTPVKYRSVYPFTARNSNEMSLKVGQLVTFRREIDANWMEGANNLGEIGIFPSGYVRRQEDTDFIPTTTPDRPKTPHNTLQMRPPEYHESTPEEPTLCLPHPVAENTQQTNGITPNHPNPQTYQMSRQNNPNPSYSTSSFPGIDKTRRFNDYEEETDKLTEWSNRKKAPNLSSSTTRGDPPISSAQQHSSHIVPQNSETYRALYPYVPMNEDELELQVNDIVFVVEKCDDGWFIGTLLRNGQFGTFPGNYVVRH
ncbi:unnamed protein product, partial [Mesorhabditis belari]|uniref:Uncharacterized protein n=1 Tax=Mesorhabditis belari TaxID=2138241 RepID=A0AAF3FBZ0_9BILA